MAVAIASFCESGVKWNADAPVEADPSGRAAWSIDGKSFIRFGFRSPFIYLVVESNIGA